MTFPDILKHYRERDGRSQSRLAEDADFDHSYISRLESGQRQPTREAVTRLCETLGLDEIETKTLMENAGFHVNDDPSPPTEADVERLILLLRGAFKFDGGSVRDRRTLYDSINLMLNGITYKEIA